ncbi:unnamed protein product [Lactuca saligna]|uniref:Uncharacterized protein n=1 Tax=Lactuca saligna TaxID=75948 RepID=A0AA35VL93_LACSI|nr:unnamed protein product [Lactuca saligna]
MDTLIAELQRTARKPRQTVSVTTEPPSESDQDDSTYALLPKKRKRRDPCSGVFITYPIQNNSTPIEHGYIAQNLQSTFTEPSPVIQEISSTLPNPAPMDQDFQSQIVEEEVLPLKGAQASRSSFETPELDISKGTSKLPESELVDVVQHQIKVFDLEQNSAEKDLIIREQDIRINKLEKENSDKDSKKSEIQADLSERRENKIRVKQLKGKMLVMKNSDKNALGDHPEMFFKKIGKKFTEKYGDRSSIMMWGYDVEKKMWIVK